MSDGGEGLLDVLGGANRTTIVTGPLGRPVEAAWRFEHRTAVIEMARASGLALAGGAEGNDPLAATTAGTGELIARAVEQGARRIIVGLGGSATTDGGLGAVEALPSPARLRTVELEVACDVRTRFVDAAAVFAPQKGAGPAQVDLLTGAAGAARQALPRAVRRRRDRARRRRRRGWARRRPRRARRTARQRLRARRRVRRLGGAGSRRRRDRHRRGSPRRAEPRRQGRRRGVRPGPLGRAAGRRDRRRRRRRRRGRVAITIRTSPSSRWSSASASTARSPNRAGASNTPPPTSSVASVNTRMSRWSWWWSRRRRRAGRRPTG